MTIPGSLSAPLLASAVGAAGPFEVSRSLRFNSGDSSELVRTPSSASNRRTWTWSGWIKRSKGAASKHVFDTGQSPAYTGLYFEGNDRLDFRGYAGGYVWRLLSTQVFRDFSAWMHVVLQFNTVASTASDRAKVWVNGQQITAWDTANYPSQNYEGGVNNTAVHKIGGFFGSGYYDGYLGEINFVDGSALDHLSFGEFDDNGVWQAIDTAGLSFGTNGFRLKFDDNSSNAALGTDSSGNSNTWTVNNLTAAAAGLATANQGFDVVTYTGNGGTQSISSLAFQPDFVWIKGRNTNSSFNVLVDSVRGVQNTLFSEQSVAELVRNTVTSFNSDGFTVGNYGNNNTNNNTYVAWCWKAGGAAVSNTDGTITSQVSASTDYGFSVCTFTSPASGNFTFGHGLSTAPSLVFMKDRENAGNWHIYHSSVSTDTSKYLVFTNSALSTYSNVWGAALPTSSVFGLGVGASIVANADAVAYCWSEVAGFSKFSSYAGSNSSQTIECGFKPAFVMIKCTTSGNDWIIQDNARGVEVLYPNLWSAEFGGNYVSFTSTGFTLNTSDGRSNSSGDTYIYAAYAEKPDKSVIDSLVDTPTNAATPTDTGVGNEVVGCYATWNPLAKSNDHTLSNGNLDSSFDGATPTSTTVGTIGISSGKFYWESTLTAQTGSGSGVAGLSAVSSGMARPGNDANTWIYSSANGNIYHNNSNSSYGNTYAVGDVIGTAFDADNGNLYFYKNGVIQNSGTAAATGLTSGPYFPAIGDLSVSNTFTASTNFGQRAFAYAAPSGYKALNTASSPQPTIADGSKYFDTKLYTGTGSSQTISTSYAPGFVWTKARGHSDFHTLIDAVRGSSKTLYSNDTAAEGTDATGITAFNSDGYSLGANTTAGSVNASGRSYVGWSWNAGANSNKTYAITVANPGSGNKYYADGALQPTLTLAEGSTYKFDQSASTNSGHPLRFSTTSDGTHGGGSEYTTGVTTAGTPGSAGAFTQIVIAASAPTLYAYCTNHSGMGFQVNTNDTGGFTIPAGSLNSTAYDQSAVWSGMVSPSPANGTLSQGFNGNLTNTFYGGISAGAYFTFTPTGGITFNTQIRVYNGNVSDTSVKINGGSSVSLSTSSWTTVATGSGTLNTLAITRGTTDVHGWFGIEIDGKLLVDSGVSVTNVPSIASQVMASPESGFSIVSYNTSDNYPTIGHGLNAEPELIIAKSKTDGNAPWVVYTKTGGLDNYLMLNSTAANSGLSGAWGTSAFTSSTFSAGWNDYYSNRDNMIAYCFAPVAGYSAMGSYLGNGNATIKPFIYLGFRPAFILIKASSISGKSWIICDYVRDGYNSNNADLSPDSIGTENNVVGAAYSLDIFSNGFQLISDSSRLNQSGATYIYYAVAENPFQVNGGLAR